MAAALAAFTGARPLLVVTATGLDAERLADDLACLLAPESDETAEPERGRWSARWRARSRCLPAWETLPFERVSPEIETMGRRLAVLHALTGTPDPALPPPPRVIVAPVRALLQRLAPLEGTAPARGPPGPAGRLAELLPELVAGATGASTRSSTAGSSPCAAASSTSSPPRPTCRSASTCGVTRSTG